MKYPIEKTIYIDIETVSEYKTFDDAPYEVQNIWVKKTDKVELMKNMTPAEAYSSRAAIFAEFGKIICISIGLYSVKNENYRIKSFSGYDEQNVLKEFQEFINSLKSTYVFCGHNIKEFDIPFLCRRMLINNIAIPKMMDYQDMKPWDYEIYDTLQLWKFGDFKNYTALDTLTTIFKIPTSKADIDGSMVGHVFWNENNLERIVQYCQQDVIAIIQIMRRFQQLDLISLDRIKIVMNDVV